MTITVIGIILCCALIISALIEPRNFWNALFMPVAVGTLFLGLFIGVRSDLQRYIMIGICILMMLVVLIFPFFLIGNGFVMMKKEGHSLKNLLSLFLGIAIIAAEIIPPVVMKLYNNRMLNYTFATLSMLEFYAAYTFAALLAYSFLYTYMPKRLKCDYIIVHGCGLLGGERVSPLLKGRVDQAVKVYNKCKVKPKIILSGGQGADEKISEAEAMKEYLIGTGFPEEEIILEDQSKTTFENLKNVKEMMDTDSKKKRYIFVTNNYHVFRTSLFAKKLKMKAKGVGCKTAGYYWPSAFIREYIAIILKYKWIPGSIICIWIITMIGMLL